MSQRSHLRIIFWIILAVCLIFTARSSPDLADLSGSRVTLAPSIECETEKTSASIQPGNAQPGWSGCHQHSATIPKRLGCTGKAAL